MAIFEPLYEWDYLASPPKLAPLTAASLPEITDGGKTWTIRMKPGIYFTDDPAFKGKPRELTADDYVYSLQALDGSQRATRAARRSSLTCCSARGRSSMRAPSRARFDFDRPIDGSACARPLHAAAALDRSRTIRSSRTCSTFAPRPRAKSSRRRAATSARARSGRGPTGSRNGSAARASCSRRIPRYRAGVLSRERRSRRMRRSCAACRARPLPQIGVIEIGIIEEDLPRLLEFDRGALDSWCCAAKSRTGCSRTASSSPSMRRAASRVRVSRALHSSRSIST